MVDFFQGRQRVDVSATSSYVPGVHTPLAGDKGDPGRPPTPAEIEAAVAAWLVANPIEVLPGPPPSPEVVAAAVSEWLIEHPPTVVGEIDATQVESAVIQYLAENPSAELTAHIESPTPHPVYDEMEDFTLIFENRLI